VWFEDPDEAVIDAELATLALSEPSWHDVDDEDWAESWKRAFPRVELAPGIVVAPPWDAEDGDLVIDPGQGFGTGHHASTRAVLLALHEVARPGGTCLDVGCGSGILAIAAARAGMQATGIDIDADAIANAAHNAAQNDVEIAVSTTPLDALPGTWEVVCANLFAEVLVTLSEALAARTGRHLLLAGILATKVDTVRARFDPVFGAPRVETDGPWVSLHYERIP
jgi:ribosomal protein L11 methyltransferase